MFFFVKFSVSTLRTPVGFSSMNPPAAQPRILRHLRRGLDTDGSGHVTNQAGWCLVTRNGTETAHSSLEMMGCNKIIST